MLKGIPEIISPSLMKTLMEMGHGDEIVLADRNFPASSCAKRLIRADGHGIVPLLDAILLYLPLDYAVEYNVALMSVTPGEQYEPTIWDEYSSILHKRSQEFKGNEYLDRFSFYERSQKAYAIIATGESARFANIILKKGVIRT